MNKCNVIRDLLPLYVDGALSEDSKSYVERHLKTCPSCAAEAEKLNISLPSEDALAAIFPSQEETKQANAESIKRVKHKFNKRTLWISLVSVFLCAVVLFCAIYIPNRLQLIDSYLYPNGKGDRIEDSTPMPEINIEKYKGHGHLEPPADWYRYEIQIKTGDQANASILPLRVNLPYQMNLVNGHLSAQTENGEDHAFIFFTAGLASESTIYNRHHPYFLAYCKDNGIDNSETVAMMKYAMEFRISSVNIFSSLDKIKAAGDIADMRSALSGGYWGAYDKDGCFVGFPKHYYPIAGEWEGYAIATVFDKDIAYHMYDGHGEKIEYNGEYDQYDGYIDSWFIVLKYDDLILTITIDEPEPTTGNGIVNTAEELEQILYYLDC